MGIITWEFWESQAFLPSQCSPHDKIQNILYREEWWPPPKFWSCECSESKASPWFKIGSFSTNHLHCLTCQWCPNNFFTRCSWQRHFILIPNPELLHTLLSTFFLLLSFEGSSPKPCEEFKGASIQDLIFFYTQNMDHKRL